MFQKTPHKNTNKVQTHLIRALAMPTLLPGHPDPPHTSTPDVYHCLQQHVRMILDVDYAVMHGIILLLITILIIIMLLHTVLLLQTNRQVSQSVLECGCFMCEL